MKIELHSRWRHRKKGTLYRVTLIKGDEIRLVPEPFQKGRVRSLWKWSSLLPLDYECLDRDF